MRTLEEALRQLARESARTLAELGIRTDDKEWIRAHAQTIASLAGERRLWSAPRFLQRLARRAARTAR